MLGEVATLRHAYVDLDVGLNGEYNRLMPFKLSGFKSLATQPTWQDEDLHYLSHSYAYVSEHAYASITYSDKAKPQGE